MGTSTIFDIIGSAIVAGLLLLTALRLNAQANETSLIYNGSVRLQQNMVVLVEWIEDDFRRIGYCQNYTKIPFPTQAIRIAGATDIRFWTDEGNDGTLDSIRWYIGATNDPAMPSTPNPRDRMIYRQVNNIAPVGWNLGVTKFLLTYYDYGGDELATPVAQPSAIYSMRIEVTCETPFTFQEQYRAMGGADTSDFQVHWQQLRMAAKNLRNR
jgi:hypothetical protein